MKIEKNKLILILFSIFVLFIVYIKVDLYRPSFSVKNLNLYESNYVSTVENNKFIFIKSKYNPKVDTAIVFYPSSFVDEKSYLPLLFELAKDGYGVYILKSFSNISFLNKNLANSVIKKGIYEKYVLMGHSFGGTDLLNYLSKQNKFSDKIINVVLLAPRSLGNYIFDSVNDESHKNNFRMLSIVGSKDGIVDLKKYEVDKSKLPSNTKYVTINGGNHSNFGNYGKQFGDLKSDISLEKQQFIVLNEIKKFLNESN